MGQRGGGERAGEGIKLDYILINHSSTPPPRRGGGDEFLKLND